MVGPFPYLTVVILPNFDGQDYDNKDVSVHINHI